jgi:AcrR family transcriptional regulator
MIGFSMTRRTATSHRPAAAGPRPAAPQRDSRAAGADGAALDKLAHWIASGALPEVTPTQQARSLRSTLAMLDAGRALLADRPLEELAVEAVCERAGTTVGAFYGRFDSKLAFFVTLQRVQTLHSQETLAGFHERRAKDDVDLDSLCAEIVQLTVANFRANVGVLRASLQHTREGRWAVFKASGDRFRAALLDKLGPHLRALPPATRRLRILFAYEALAGVLVHATLNDPGPLGIDDQQLAVELKRLIKSYLIAPA